MVGHRFVSAGAIPLVAEMENSETGKGSRMLARREPEIDMFVKVEVGTMLVYAWQILRGVWS